MASRDPQQWNPQQGGPQQWGPSQWGPSQWEPGGAPPGPPTTGGRRPILPFALGFLSGAVALGLIWGLVAIASANSTFTLNGTITLLPSSGYSYSSSSNYTSTSGGCAGTGGYSDMYVGTNAAVYDPAGAVVAVGSIDTSSSTPAGCAFHFTVPDVPAGAKLYQIEVSHRGKITVNEDQAESGTASFSLGN